MRKFSVVAIIVLMFALSASALAASKPGGYKGSAGKVQSAVAGGQVLGDTTTAGQLPFTGTELGVFTAAGLLLIGAGFSMRRAARRRNYVSVQSRVTAEALSSASAACAVSARALSGRPS